MPKPNTNTTPSPKPAAKPVQKKPVATRPIVWAKLAVNGLPISSVPLTCAKMKALLGWETEAEFAERKGKEPNADPKRKAQFPDKADFLTDDCGNKVMIFEDMDGNRVVCWNNVRNRPLDITWAKTLGQEVLMRHWAGPTTMSGETVNGETIIISKTGVVESAQHRGIGFVLACQLWAQGKDFNGKETDWKTLWPTEPVFDALVVTGVSDSPEVVATHDCVKPRSESDAFYTSEIFAKMNPPERKEFSRMAAKAIDLFWLRTSASDGREKYKTHSAIMGLTDRHPKLLKALDTIFKLNEDRVISNLKLSPGCCSTLLYLMGTSSSDAEAYLANDPREEKGLKFDRWELAVKFFTELGDSLAIRKALGSLINEDSGTGGRQAEKHAILAKAWALFADGQEITERGLAIDSMFATNPDTGVRKLVKFPTCGGIDAGEASNKADDDEVGPTPEQVEAAKAEERRKREEIIKARHQAIQDKLASKKPPVPTKPAAPAVLAQPANKRPDATASGKHASNAKPVEKKKVATPVAK